MDPKAEQVPKKRGRKPGFIVKKPRVAKNIEKAAKDIKEALFEFLTPTEQLVSLIDAESNPKKWKPAKKPILCEECKKSING